MLIKIDIRDAYCDAYLYRKTHSNGSKRISIGFHTFTRLNTYTRTLKAYTRTLKAYTRPCAQIHAYTHEFRAQTCAQNRPQLSYLKTLDRIPNLVWKSDLNSYRERLIRKCHLMLRSGYCTIPHFIALHCT